ncbi:hypothetical protein HOA55_00805 [archaeon]|jgi:hypothetical protein|nr:hypothetical protein [archaeon]MBT3578205.1 hypothetical protein [archaeon]MBT6819874.1 hypothetical protein [archaeon]MBT6956376.1 hypothetical protein [archaeon]MBT7025656.1 hypothetical protein [archaeon]
MKKIFRKAMTVLGSLALVGATVGTAAAAAYPAPFTSNTAIVVGANAAPADNIAASNIAANLGTASVGTVATTTGDGDSFKFEKSSTKYHLGDNLTAVVSSSLNDDKLPVLLSDGKFLDKNNDEFDYTQKIEMNATLDLTMWENQDYAENEPTVGFLINSGDTILTYSLDFTDTPDVDDLDTTDLPIMGKSYYVLTNTTGGDTITLLNAASSAILSEGESTTLNVEGTPYTVSIDYVSSTEVKITANGETTNSLAEGGTFKLTDGSYIGVKDIMYSAKDTGISKVEFSIGSGKLKLTNSSNVQINDNSVTELTSVITADTDSKLTTISLVWAAEEDMFITETSSITMPEFEAVKLTFAGLTYPTEEVIEVRQGADTYAILNDFPLKDGEADISLLYATTNGAFAGTGKDATHTLVTSSGTTLNFTKSTDSYFVASYVSGDDAESYLMRPTNFVLDGSNDEFDMEYWVDEGFTILKKGLKLGSTVSIGNVELTVGPVTSTGASSNKTIGLTAGTNMNFDELYSAEGLKVYLPIEAANTSTAFGAYNFSTDGDGGQIGHNATSWNLTMVEEDKDGAIGSSDGFSILLGWDSSTTAEVEVSGVDNESATFKEIGDTDVWRSFMYSPLATEFLWDKPSSGQDSVKVIYHGSEVSADVYITPPEVTIGTGTEAGVMTVDDTEAASVAGKNLIVVGGSAINSVAAELLGGAYSDGEFTTMTGVAAGEFLIQSFDRSGKTAMLVAGFNAADTTKATTYLLNNDVDTTVGTKYKGTSTTEASLVVA